MIRIRDIKLPAGCKKQDVMNEIARILCLDKIYPGNSYPDFSYVIKRKSVDARKKSEIFIVLTVEVLTGSDDEQKILKFFEDNSSRPKIRKFRDKIITEPDKQYEIPDCGQEKLTKRPIVVGSGPSGLFCALLLARRGFRPIVIERGQRVDKRSGTVEKFWRTGELDSESNVQFGEGGAGTFSDGKLTTLTKDKNGINSFVIRTFFEHGAADEILYESHPHIGTDILKKVVSSIRDEIIDLGGEFLFDTKLTDICINENKISSVILTDRISSETRKMDADICVLCIGHSARDTFEMLHDRGIPMSAKNFAVGFRAVHKQAAVNLWQYAHERPEDLGLPCAIYKAAAETKNGRRVYTFCMCPGGYVVNASSEAGRLCVNGMSESKRDGRFANSAVIAAVTPEDFVQETVPSDHPLAGMHYQRKLEEAAFLRGGGNIPAERFADFKSGIKPEHLPDIEGGIKGAARCADLRGILSDELDEAIIESMHEFGYTMKGFDDDDTVLLGIESRTSSPVRIERNSSCESAVTGLYPCGEGAGYAGGIVSAAADGIRCAESIIKRFTLSEDRIG